MSLISKMFHTNVFKLFLVILTMSIHGMAHQENTKYNHPALPSFDPHISEFVWFSTSNVDHKLGNLDSYSTINNAPFILPGPVETLVDPTKDRNKVPNVQKTVIMLK